MDETLFLPTLSFLEYGHVWTGSLGPRRFRIVPGEGSMRAEFWTGELCYELSQVQAQADFPVSGEGLEQLRAWLEAQCAAGT